MELSSTFVAGAAAVLIAAAILHYALFSATKHDGNLPPGPPKHFLLGHLAVMPREKDWLTYSEWAKKYGENRTIFDNL
jgi:hypothetical protein